MLAQDDLEAARERYKQTGATDAALVAYDRCNKGSKPACVQAIVLFLLDKEPDIAAGLVAKHPSPGSTQKFEFERNLLEKAVNTREVKYSKLLGQIARLINHTKLLGQLLLRDLLADKPMWTDGPQLIAKLCRSNRKLGNALVAVVSIAKHSQLRDAGVACTLPR
ncbi:MAG TPA: hypothetical protein EYN66_01215, partial [Myxococcales bacterium]|nr:hypothetical protein [Myxococcales bacterium]